MLWLEIPAYAGSTISWSSQPPRRRIIPAYAGSTYGGVAPSRIRTDHPRIRGEHSRCRTTASAVRGSSPHTRGAPPLRSTRPAGTRIIPAYAGSTGSTSHKPSGMPDHPRIRGEHLGFVGGAHQMSGSSPHTRGARCAHLRRRPGARIIPAYAGSTWTAASSSSMPRDHPRIRGEHKETPMYIEIDYGSSPHTRGAPDARLLDLPHDGIIPAYAGSTRRRVEVPEYRSDHPRIRGEHWGSTTGSWSSRGSSPHTRGAPVRKGKRSGPVGIIPAYAGSTRDRGFSLGCDGDHPRIRGEHACEALYGARPGGSSPHTRGALLNV